MKNFTLAEITRTIPYVPALRPYVGSVSASILMRQMDFWFATKNGAPFFKFMVEQKGEKAHPAYKTGDSWCEELSMSPDEFRSAFDRIGFRYKSFTEYKRAMKMGCPFRGLFYVSYHDKIKGLTWYLRNHALVDALLYEICFRKSEKSISVNWHSQSTYLDKVDTRKSGKSIPNYTETTTEITAEKTTTKQVEPVVDCLASPYKQTFTILLDLIPSTEHSPRLTTAVSAALDIHDEYYVRSNIEYCIQKHSPDGEKSLGGMIVEALTVDYAKATRARVAAQAEAKAKANSIMERYRQIEQERQRLDAKTQEDKEWCESDEGRTFLKHILSDDP